MNPERARTIFDRNASFVAAVWESFRSPAVFLMDTSEADCQQIFMRFRAGDLSMNHNGSGIYAIVISLTPVQYEWAEEQAGPLEFGEDFMDYYVSVGAYWFRRRAVAMLN